jgi:hypothetical protein
MDYPDSLEAVALSLLEKILERDDQPKTNEPPAARLISLYAQCLEVVRGDRMSPDLRMMH